MKRTNPKHPLALIITSAILAALTLSACSGEGEVQEVEFAVTDSLLADTISVADADLAFRAPAGFTPTDDSTAIAHDPLLQATLATYGRVSLIATRIDTVTGTTMQLLRIDSLGLSGDTAAYMEQYRSQLVDATGRENLTWGDYNVDDVYVKNLLVTDSQYVRFHLMLFGPTTTTLELRFRMPRQEYGNLLSKLESSVGSVYIPSRAASEKQ